MGTDIVEVLEVRDRGYVLVSGQQYEGLVPAAHLRQLTADEVDELEAEGAEDDAAMLERAAMDLGQRIAEVQRHHGIGYVRSIPVVGDLLEELGDRWAMGEPFDDPAAGKPQELDDEAFDQRETVRIEDELTEPPEGEEAPILPPPGPGAGLRATGWRSSGRPAPRLVPRQEPQHANPPAPYGVATVGTAGVATTSGGPRATTASATAPAKRMDPMAPLVNGAPPPAPSRGPARITVSEPVRRGDDPDPGKVATATAPAARADD
jgi:hypothetical protein